MKSFRVRKGQIDGGVVWWLLVGWVWVVDGGVGIFQNSNLGKNYNDWINNERYPF
jgi:hypothetical protein